MLSITGGRSLATAVAALVLRSAVGDDTSPSAPTAADGLGPLAACPVSHRRPRDLDQFQAACAATDQPVIELDAIEAQEGQQIWHMGSFRTVYRVHRDGVSVLLWFCGDGGTASRFTDMDTPLYRLDGSAGGGTVRT